MKKIMLIAPQSFYSQLWERGEKQMSLKFGLKKHENNGDV